MQPTSSSSCFCRHKATGETGWDVPPGGCAAAPQLFHAPTAEGVAHAGVSEVIVRCEQGAYKWAQCRHPTAHTFFSHIRDEKAAVKCHIATAAHADIELLSRGSVVGTRCLDASTIERCFTDVGGCGAYGASVANAASQRLVLSRSACWNGIQAQLRSFFTGCAAATALASPTSRTACPNCGTRML